MTTIAWDGEYLAADTLTTSNGLFDSRRIKILKINKCLIGGTGIQAMCKEFLDWFRDGADYENLPTLTDSNGIIIHPDKTITMFSESGHWRIEGEKIYSLGSGYMLALGAMAAGASAKRAVQVAMKYDLSTGGNVTVLKL